MGVAGELPDDLLDLIYEAAGDSTLWSSVLIRVADMTGSQGGVIFGVEQRAGLVAFTFNGRLSEESHRAYEAQHIQNPWAEHMMAQPAGAVVASDQIVPLRDLRRTAFFSDVLRPQGVGHNAMMPLVAKDDFRAVFNICRSESQGPFQPDTLDFFSRLVPHLRRALLLGLRIEGYAALRQAQHQVLDQLAIGVVLLDRSGQVMFANRAARRLAAPGGPLRLIRGGLGAALASEQRRLDAVIQSALRGLAPAAVSIAVPEDGRLLTVLATAVRARNRDRLIGLDMQDAAAVVLLSDPAAASEVPAAWVMDAFGLTLAEARIALSLGSGASVPEVARRFAISPNTVKTHLKRIFTKTGTTRQSDLARILAALRVLAPEPDRANGADSL